MTSLNKESPDLPATSKQSVRTDPGFPVGGALTLQGAPTYKFARFSKKLHEIKKILVGGGRPSLDPKLVRKFPKTLQFND